MNLEQSFRIFCRYLIISNALDGGAEHFRNEVEKHDQTIKKTQNLLESSIDKDVDYLSLESDKYLHMHKSMDAAMRSASHAAQSFCIMSKGLKILSDALSKEYGNIVCDYYDLPKEIILKIKDKDILVFTKSDFEEDKYLNEEYIESIIGE